MEVFSSLSGRDVAVDASLQGDFAAGVRSSGVTHARGDFATGARRLPPVSMTGDFATGCRSRYLGLATGDFAIGARAEATRRDDVSLERRLAPELGLDGQPDRQPIA
jgi:hypothetical protein